MQDILIARQPIFDHEYKLSSYEVLFRNKNARRKSDDHMTAQVIVTALLDIGLEKLSGGYKININASSSLLLSDIDIIHALPPEHVGIEVLETVPVTDAIIQSCKRLKDKGFTILLDDMVYAPHLEPLIELADIIKVDLPRVANLAEEVRKLRKYPVKLLAEKVETHEQYEQIKALNFDYAQGYFFSRPEIIEGRKLPDSKLAILRALQKVMTAQAISDIHDVIKQDVSLSYRLVKYINSASFGLRKPVESIEQALATLGEGKSSELIKTSLIRAHLLEGIAKARHEKETGDDFLLGMFSILDALLDIDMKQALVDLSLPASVREGLLDNNSVMGKKLSMCLALEQGDWESVQQWASSVTLISLASTDFILRLSHGLMDKLQA